MIQIVAILWLVSLAVTGLGTWRITTAYAGKEFQDYKIAELKRAAEVKDHDARLLDKAVRDAAEAGVRVRVSDGIAGRLEAENAALVGQLAASERDLRLSRAAISLFDLSTGDRRTPEAAKATAGTAAGTAGTEATLGDLLRRSAENNANHLRCVGQVEGLQTYLLALYSFCGGDLK